MYWHTIVQARCRLSLHALSDWTHDAGITRHSARSVRRTWGEKRALRGCDVLKKNIMQNEV